MRQNEVAVIIPNYRYDLLPEEQISLIHYDRYLSALPTWTISPEGLSNHYHNIPQKTFDQEFFKDRDSYSRLLLSRDFYSAFQQYKYILIYQMDCLVFSDQVLSWCHMGYDFIGAPWFKNPDKIADGFSRVGNGGLSLRRVDAFLKVIDQKTPNIKDILSAPLPDLALLPRSQRLRKKLQIWRSAWRGSAWYRQHYSLNEDHFWSDRARLFWSEFKIAPVEVGLRFAFERAPRYCFEQNGGRLPFGCHAWAKWDREFWEPYLIHA